MPNNRILIVDDEKIIRMALENELKEHGYKVESVSDGQEAVNKVKLNKYGLIFVDMVMPVMDGVETCKAIKKISPETELVFMTGVLDKDTAFREIAFNLAGGQLHYLYKPFIEGEVVKIARKVLEAKQK